jgi:hypothetical protein
MVRMTISVAPKLRASSLRKVESNNISPFSILEAPRRPTKARHGLCFDALWTSVPRSSLPAAWPP